MYPKHTTAAAKINETEPLLLEDMRQVLERFAPCCWAYKHNDFSIRTVNMTPDECPNGQAHCQHLLLGTSETVPIAEGTIHVGTYQSIFLTELDRPRSREVLVQMVEEQG